MKTSRNKLTTTTASPPAHGTELADMIAQYKAINRRWRHRALVPQVGVFWMDLATATVYADKTSLARARDMGNIKIHPRGHYDVWHKIVKRHPVWRGREYEDIPRGRVVWFNELPVPRFMVYANRAGNTPRMKAALARAFNLPRGHYDFDWTDEHYELIFAQESANKGECSCQDC